MKNKKTIFVVTIASCILSVLFSAVDIGYSQKVRVDNLLDKIVPLFFVMPILVLFLSTSQQKIFNKPNNLWYLVPCLLVAINNLPFIPWFKGMCEFAEIGIAEILLFLLYCLLVGAFEEFIFRGIFFPSLLGYFNKDKKSLIKAMILSSLLFGFMHILNLFNGAGLMETLLQICYSTLIGGLCVFVFVKTYNILCSILVHSTYNFCGLLFNSSIGLGNGVYFDTATVIITIIIGLIVAAFVFISLKNYSNKERHYLYEVLDI